MADIDISFSEREADPQPATGQPHWSREHFKQMYAESAVRLWASDHEKLVLRVRRLINARFYDGCFTRN